MYIFVKLYSTFKIILLDFQNKFNYTYLHCHTLHTIDSTHVRVMLTYNK